MIYGKKYARPLRMRERPDDSNTTPPMTISAGGPFAGVGVGLVGAGLYAVELEGLKLVLVLVGGL